MAKKEVEGLVAVIYARYSSENQREESIEGQMRECYAFAKKNGISVVGEYIDRAFSAKTDRRPDFQRMIKDSAKRNFNLVIVWKLDRFARNRYDSAHYKALLKKNGIKVMSAVERISDGAEGILLESLLEGMAEYYSADLSEKVLRGHTENALKCKYNGGTMPIGYYADKEQHYVADSLTAPFVLEAFRHYDEGLTMSEIAAVLNQHGLKNKRGGDIDILNEDQVRFWFERLRNLNINELSHRKRLIDTFLNSVFVYDNKLLINCNYPNTSTIVRFSDINATLNGSDIIACGRPKSRF